MSLIVKTAAATVALVAGSMTATVFAADAAKAVGTPTANRYTQQLIARMDTDKNGKVSKAEFMKFMEAEWNVLDNNKDGSLQTVEFENREYFKREGTD